MAKKVFNLSKVDDRKIKKLEDVVVALKNEEERSFNITKLTSIKSLCGDPKVAIQFGLYLSNLAHKKMKSLPCPKHTELPDWEIFKRLAARGLSSMKKYLKAPNQENLANLKKVLREMKDIQNETRSGPYGCVIRTIKSMDLLIIEESICCLLHQNDAAYWAYRIARSYTEKYNPFYGTGLIPDSIPRLEDVINFWRKGNYLKAIDIIPIP